MRATRNGEVTGEPQSLGTHDHLVVEAWIVARRIVGRILVGRIVRRTCCRRRVEQRPYFVVGGLGEPLVPRADREERARRLHRDDRVRNVGKLAHRFGRGNRHREHHPTRALRASDLHCGAGCSTGRDAVVDDDDRSTLDRGHRTAAPVQTNPPFQLGTFASFDRRDLVRGDLRDSNDFRIEHPHAPLPRSRPSPARVGMAHRASGPP